MVKGDKRRGLGLGVCCGTESEVVDRERAYHNNQSRRRFEKITDETTESAHSTNSEIHF